MLTIPFIRIRTFICCYVLTALYYFTELYCVWFYTALIYLLDKSFQMDGGKLTVNQKTDNVLMNL